MSDSNSLLEAGTSIPSVHMQMPVLVVDQEQPSPAVLPLGASLMRFQGVCNCSFYFIHLWVTSSWGGTKLFVLWALEKDSPSPCQHLPAPRGSSWLISPQNIFPEGAYCHRVGCEVFWSTKLNLFVEIKFLFLLVLVVFYETRLCAPEKYKIIKGNWAHRTYSWSSLTIRLGQSVWICANFVLLVRFFFNFDGCISDPELTPGLISLRGSLWSESTSAVVSSFLFASSV